MARLPYVGGDDGNWGTILNDYLSQAHQADGTIKPTALPDASLISKGMIQLGGDLAGTATVPTVPALAAKYEKPASGIPEADLAAAVQTKLNADVGTDADVAGYVNDLASSTRAALSTKYAPQAHTHGVADLTATGTRDGTTFLRGDNTWAPPPSSPVKSNGAGDAIIPEDTNDSFVIGSDRMDRDPADPTKNIRMFFDKATGAFRAGQNSGSSDWDAANRGVRSAGFGDNSLASGNWSFAAGWNCQATGESAAAFNRQTVASGAWSHAEGSTTLASGLTAHAEGDNAKAIGQTSHAEGRWTEARGNYSRALGNESLATRRAQEAFADGMFSTFGDAQVCRMIGKAQTTTATPAALTSGSSATPSHANPPETNVLTLVANRAFQVRISAVARRTDVQGEMAGFTWDGLVGRDATGSARIIGTPITAGWSDAAAAGWALAVSVNTADATNNYLEIRATGEAGKTIRWVARIDMVEVAG